MKGLAGKWLPALFLGDGLLLCRSYEEGGFSTLAVDNLNVEMGDILSRVIRKRRLQIHGIMRHEINTWRLK